MTNNRTAELLRGGLTERGIEYQAIGKRLTYWNRDGSHNDCDDADFVADEQNGYLIVEGLTPEQAIAATLGSGKPFADAISELRKTVREAFSAESVSMLVEGNAIMRAIDDVEAAELENGTYERIAELEQLIRNMYHEHPIYYFEQWMEDHGIEVER